MGEIISVTISPLEFFSHLRWIDERPLLRSWRSTYEEVEAVKERLAEKLFGLHSGCGTYIRHLTREIASGRLREPPEKERIGKMCWIAELEAKGKGLYARFPRTWAHGDLHIGRITSDGAALVTFAKPPGEVPVHPPDTAGERLVEYLLRQDEAQAA